MKLFTSVQLSYYRHPQRTATKGRAARLPFIVKCFHFLLRYYLTYLDVFLSSRQKLVAYFARSLSLSICSTFYLISDRETRC